jgi:hypothetical protein
MTVETWRDVPNYVGLYEVSSKGRVRSIERRVEAECGGIRKVFKFKGRILRQSLNTAKYMSVSLSANGEKRCQQVHRMVCEAFNGPPPPGRYHAAHGDGRKTNNVSSNLRWATPLENTRDNELHGKISRGAKHSRALERAWATRRKKMLEAA